MKRRLELRIDELHLPAGARGGLRAQEAIRANIVRLLDGGSLTGGDDVHDAVARAVHDRVAPHAGPPRPR